MNLLRRAPSLLRASGVTISTVSRMDKGSDGGLHPATYLSAHGQWVMLNAPALAKVVTKYSIVLMMCASSGSSCHLRMPAHRSTQSARHRSSRARHVMGYKSAALRASLGAPRLPEDCGTTPS